MPHRRVMRFLIFSGVAVFTLLMWGWQPDTAPETKILHPLVSQYIKDQTTLGGRYYIPQSWLDNVNETVTPREPRSILDAAELALELSLRNGRYIEGTKIPLIVHQTWKSMDPETWSDIIQQSVSEWLEYAVHPWEGTESSEMAYFLWDDNGLEALFKTYESAMWKQYRMLPYPVEKTDAFRVAVLRWFGGVYADVDVKPLQHPISWVQTGDLHLWTDMETEVPTEPVTAPPYKYPETSNFSWQRLTSGLNLSHMRGVGAIFGIECDTRADSDDYWRMGFSYPVQLTNWALALAPHHPVAVSFLTNLVDHVNANSTRLEWIDPLDLTGPPAITGVLKSYTKEVQPDVRWEGLSGLDDPRGGRGKVVAGDVLILPITGFSPGRGDFHNMGSQPTTDPNARIQHAFAGSWRHTDLKVHIGKFCRNFLGGCRDWSKIPDPR
ncbi:glycosyltransferase family 32 protein [Polychaeton citri CBS 116435]|uniref:Glycosyltransferase family 32 protein n=1 Tax=Polychaeton citri CBS 116435 TaxID=1314669 RepID=A0A9P4Q2I3_9PEZI|nr:glycosyltransferase family 32 protein [Polychaeton citri CBS 116435]